MKKIIFLISFLYSLNIISSDSDSSDADAANSTSFSIIKEGQLIILEYYHRIEFYNKKIVETMHFMSESHSNKIEVDGVNHLSSDVKDVKSFFKLKE